VPVCNLVSQRVEPGTAVIAGEFADRAADQERVVGKHCGDRPRRVPSAGLALHRTRRLLGKCPHRAELDQRAVRAVQLQWPRSVR
jgi:hypothetical protein